MFRGSSVSTVRGSGATMTICGHISPVPSMSSNKIIIGSLILCLVFGAAWAFGAFALVPVANAARTCDTFFASDGEKVDCWLQLVFERLRSEGIAEAYDTFEYIYDSYPLFGATGCHQHAHKVGDTAYYELFVARGLDVTDMFFPQETTSCGYGFFHGFIEHLIQDHPDPAYVTKTCEYLREKYTHSMRDIGTICYHASGHGFTIAKADTLEKYEWGSVRELVDRKSTRLNSSHMS